MKHLNDCPICDRSELTFITDRGKDFFGQSVMSCDHCGVFFQTPQMTEQELSRYYTTSYSIDYRGGAKPDAKAMEYRDGIAQYRVNVLSKAGVLAPGRSLLEIGCGAGNFLKLCDDLGMESWGVELSHGYSEHARSQSLNVVTGCFPSVSGPHAKYDVIALFHVLEHLPSPRQTLEAIRSFLADDGRLIVEVPDLRRSLGVRWSERYFHLPHLFDFTEPSLSYLLNRAGFTLLLEDYCESQPARHHHLLAVAAIGDNSCNPAVDPIHRRSTRRRLRFWKRFSRIVSPMVHMRRLLRKGSVH